MANTNTITTIVAGLRRAFVYVTIDSDGTEETDLVVYDSSAIATTLGRTDPANCRLLGIKSATNSLLGVFHLEFDASTDVVAWAIPQQSMDMCFNQFGGLKNTSGSGKTGDITLTTTGLVAGDKLTFVLEVSPEYTAA